MSALGEWYQFRTRERERVSAMCLKNLYLDNSKLVARASEQVYLLSHFQYYQDIYNVRSFLASIYLITYVYLLGYLIVNAQNSVGIKA